MSLWKNESTQLLKNHLVLLAFTEPNQMYMEAFQYYHLIDYAICLESHMGEKKIMLWMIETF